MTTIIIDSFSSFDDFLFKEAQQKALQMKTIQCTFPNSSKIYTYHCRFNVKVGDYVTVPVHGGKVAAVEVVNINQPGEYSGPYTYAIGPIDLSKEIARREASNRLITIRTRLREIEQEIRQQELWKEIARKSPEARKLLAEGKRLKKLVSP